ncbi:MAG: SAM-dependent methyltransferase [Myxococcales bacterium]|nr:SAM-dependent methyltransferase [Myxococcales bacterium]MCB9530816.1 SAM-dependent methyltransferase [Myxococcales bacterium]
MATPARPKSGPRLELSARLQSVAELVPRGARVADVCADHGLLPCALVLDGVARRAVAVDVAEAPCREARANVARFALGDRVEVRRGDGLGALNPGEVDGVIVSGVGGRIVLEILGERSLAHLAPAWLVVQANKKVPDVRVGLIKRGWAIADERLCEEGGRYYTAIRFERAATPPRLKRADVLLGPTLRRRGGPLFIGFLEHTREWMSEKVTGLARAPGPAADAAATDLELVDLELAKWTAAAAATKGGP